MEVRLPKEDQGSRVLRGKTRVRFAPAGCVWEGLGPRPQLRPVCALTRLRTQDPLHAEAAALFVLEQSVVGAKIKTETPGSDEC